MGIREIRVALHHFWGGFQIEHLERRFPSLSRKYRLIADQDRPDLTLFSVFPGNRFSVPPDHGVPSLFLTGEDVAPDMTRCDFAISFRRDIDDPRHMRIPNWVQRLSAEGYAPRQLLSAERPRGEPGGRFCSFIHANSVPLREEFVRVLSARAPVDCPGKSMNNMPAIGGSLKEKLDFLRQRRFCITFENAATPGYSTEKLPEALLAGTVPLYWGDPQIGLDFNAEAFLDLAGYPSLEALADAVMAIESDPAALRRLRDRPAFPGDRLPDCADEERIFAFWDSILDPLSRRAGEASARISLADRIEKDFSAGTTERIGFHGDRYLVQAVGQALEGATLFIETGSNEGTSLAYAASLRPDLVMRSCEPSAQGLAKARRNCAPYPLVKISDKPSPDALFDVLAEFPDTAAHHPVFWLDAHFHGVPLPLDQEVALLTSAYPRGCMFIDDFQIPDRPDFGFDAYPDGTIGLDYVLPHLNRMQGYKITLPRYRSKTSTHHPLRGWCCIRWNWERGDELFADLQLYQTHILPPAPAQPAQTAPAAPAAAAPSRAEQSLMDWLAYGTHVDEKRRILYVETPKCACTSIKHLLRTLSGAGDLTFNPAAPETRLDMMIHDRAQNPLRPLTAFQGRDLAEIVQGEGWFRFCVVRHPVERFFSAWRDKVFLCEPNFERYLIAGQRYVDFAGFFRRVVGQEDPLSCDVHWRMQAALLLPDQIAYSRIYGLQDLASLEADLKQHLARLGLSSELPPMRRFNEGFSISPQGFITPEILDGLRQFYNADFARFGFPDYQIEPGPARSASDLVNPFTDAVFDRNRTLAAHFAWQKSHARSQ